MFQFFLELARANRATDAQRCGKDRDLHLAMHIAIGLLVFAIVSGSAEADQKSCFVPGKYSETASFVEVDHESAVCKAFQRELNATCGGGIPIVKFIPQLKDSGLTTPKWEAIALYNADGSENDNAFGKLRSLAYATAYTTYFGDKEALANRDVKSTLDSVRAARRSGRPVVFEKTNIELDGKGKSETLYRLFTNGTRNPAKFTDAMQRKTEPVLYLERVVSLAASKIPGSEMGIAAGRYLTATSADLIMFENALYLMTWTNNPRGVLVYSPSAGPIPAAHPDSSVTHQTNIVLYERCVFEFKPRGK